MHPHLTVPALSTRVHPYAHPNGSHNRILASCAAAAIHDSCHCSAPHISSRVPVRRLQLPPSLSHSRQHSLASIHQTCIYTPHIQYTGGNTHVASNRSLALSSNLCTRGMPAAGAMARLHKLAPGKATAAKPSPCRPRYAVWTACKMCDAHSSMAMHRHGHTNSSSAPMLPLHASAYVVPFRSADHPVVVPLLPSTLHRQYLAVGSPYDAQQTGHGLACGCMHTMHHLL